MPNDRPSPSKPLTLTPWTFVWAATWLLLALLSFKKIGSYDLGFHLKIGEWIWLNHQVPHQDLWTQTGGDYLDPHVLFQMLLFKLHQWGGFDLLSIGLTLGLVVPFALLVPRLRTAKVPEGLQVAFFLAALFLIERRFIPRPEIVSWIFFGWNLWVLEDPRRDRRWLFTLPFVQWLWIWTEGLFILGFVVQVLFLVGRWLEQRKWDPTLGKAFGLGLLLSLLNPNGWRGLLFPFTLWQRFQDPLYQSSITEFLPPLKVLSLQNLHYDLHLHLWLFLGLSALGLAGLLWTWPGRTPIDFLLFSTFTFLAWTSVRNIPFFVWAVLPLLARVVPDLESRTLVGLFRNRWTPWIAALLVLFLGVRVLTNAYYVDERRLDRFGVGLDTGRLPIACADYLKQNRLEGRMLNSLDWGGWLVWLDAGKPYLDGRLEVPSRDRFQDYLRSFQPEGLGSFLDQLSPDLIVMEYNSAGPWARQLKTLPGWRLSYFDGNSAVYLHAKYAPQVPALDAIQWMAQKGLHPLAGNELIQEVDGTGDKGMFQTRTYPMDLGSEGLFALGQGQYAVAQALFAEQLRVAGGGFEEIYFNLGVASLHLQQWEAGRTCLRKVLQLDPGNAEARRMLQEIP